MSTLKDQKELAVKREISKLYKQNFGKGPETTEVKIYQNFVFMKFEGAFSQIEENLMKSDQGTALVEKIRDEKILRQTEAYVPALEAIVAEKVSKVNYMMQEENGILYMFVLFENDINIM